MVKNKQPQPNRKFIAQTEKPRLKELRLKFGKNKKLPRGYRLQTLIALSYYPELIDVDIEFRFSESDTILSTKPTNLTIPIPGLQRKYIIYISKKTSAGKFPVMLKNLDFNMQVGVIGHELGHVADFIRKNGAQVIKDAALYGLKAYQKKLEKRVDRITIKHGLGPQLLDYAAYINKLAEKFPDEKYYKEYNQVYMSAAEIQAKMKSLKLYKESK